MVGRAVRQDTLVNKQIIVDVIDAQPGGLSLELVDGAGSRMTLVGWADVAA